MTSVLESPAIDAVVAEAKAYLRAEGTHEDGLIGRLAGSAVALCEAFVGQWLVVREGTEIVPAIGGWQRLQAIPVSAITAVETLAVDGSGIALPMDDYEIDIDAAGAGWVRIGSSSETARARVKFVAGKATEWGDLPEPLRQGVLRLVAHFYSHRSDEIGTGPPAAVTALWRPWRRIVVGQGVRHA